MRHLSDTHVAVNTRLLLPGSMEGISRFAYEVLKRITRAHPEVRFSFLFDRPYDPAFVFGENVRPYVVPPPARHPLLWHAWFHAMVPWKLKQLKPQLFFSPELYLTNVRHLPQIPVFHDIAYEHDPHDLSPWAARYLLKYSPRYAHRAARILTVSEYSRQDLIQQYHLPADKVEVVYNGAGSHFQPVSQIQQQRVREKYTGGAPYFLFVGTLQPRKNVASLLQAFDRFRAELDGPVKLVLAGKKGWLNEGMETVYMTMKHKEDVVLTGFVPDEVLPSLYSAALGLCFVPFVEGFGIPVLEAMACDTAVICSHTSALPEVAGNAALLVDPYQVESIAAAMKILASDPAERTALIIKGREQRQRFSWDRTADKVWRVLERFLADVPTVVAPPNTLE